MTGDPPKPRFCFAGIPARVIGDQRLTALHFRALASIALHDQMSARTQGQGCWASLKTLSEECGCVHTSLSAAINDLGGWGYVAIDRHPDDRRRHVLRVLYTGEDVAVLKKVRPPPNNVVSPQSNSSEIVRLENQQVVGIIEGTPPNILRKDIPQKGSNDIPQKRGSGNGRNPNGVLAQVQRRLKRTEPIPEAELHGMTEASASFWSKPKAVP